MGSFFFKRWLHEPALPLAEVERALAETVRQHARRQIEEAAAGMNVRYADVVRILREVAETHVSSIFDAKYKEHPQAVSRGAMFLCYRDEALPAAAGRIADEPLQLTDVAHVPDLPFQVLQLTEIHNLPFRALRQYASLDRQPNELGRPSSPPKTPRARLGYLRAGPGVRMGVVAPVRVLVRSCRRLFHQLSARGIPIVYDNRYRHSISGVPLDPLRGDKVLGALDEAGLLAARLLSEPRPASLQNLLRVHTPEYLQARAGAGDAHPHPRRRGAPCARSRRRSTCSG